VAEKKKTAVKKSAPAKAKTTTKITRVKKTRSFGPLKWLAAPFVATGRYVGGSWRELREVRWPNRKMTWGLTLAVLVFSGVFTLFIILLDLLFDFISKRILL